MTVGEDYEVVCAEINWKEDHRTYFIPLIGILHTDTAFNFPRSHYHIDGRFEMHPRMLHKLRMNSGHTQIMILPQGTANYDFKRLIGRSLKCTGEHTGLTVPDYAENYNLWYDSYVGKACQGRRCPHLNTPMLEKDGKLVCTLHNLTADLLNRKVIPRHQ